MNIIFFDDESVRLNLLPLSFTRPLADFRVGITTIREKWLSLLGETSSSYLTTEYLSEKYPLALADDGDNLFIAGHLLPVYSQKFAEEVVGLDCGVALFAEDTLVAFRGSFEQFCEGKFIVTRRTEFPVIGIRYLYDIFTINGDMIVADYKNMNKSDCRKLSDSNRVIGSMADDEGNPLVYIAPGAKVEGAFLNTTHGPIVIGRDAEVMEGSTLRGPISLGTHATINMGTKVYPATTIGPWCKVGGELNNVVMMGYSNKAHDGFLGNAVIGEWCNLGAGCVASNLKNDYTPIKLWNYPAHRFLKTGLQFCGLIMGDHSKAGINTMFNTATVVGVGVNVHGSGFPRNFIPSFSEGGASGFSDVSLTKFFDIAQRVMARRGMALTDADRHIFEEIYRTAENYK